MSREEQDDAARRAKHVTKATAANAKVMSRYALAKLKAERKSPPRPAPAKVQQP